MGETTDIKPEVAEPVVVESPVEETSSEKKGTDTVPYARFKEVISEKNSAIERLSDLESKLQNQLAMTQDLQTRYSQAEDLLNAIRGMAADENMKPHIEAIDAKLRGVEEDVDTGEITQEEGEKKVAKILKQHKEEINDLVQTSRAEQIFNLANERASRYMEQLPEEYTDKDREIIGRVWHQEVDWDAIEADPTSLNVHLAESLDRVLNWYGEPKGYKAPATATPAQEVKAEPTPEVKIKEILDKEWGSVGDDGQPILTEDDFRKEAARVIKLSNRGRA